jgi:alkanesulfonate monooxygenase SsuD/methylene tetrahydromethanopterin reductase-like flavin-dependent oxidoreductase (luciferase family)
VEFGIFVAMYHPDHRRDNGETEQDVLRAELDVVQAADRSNFKYVWASEHHFLREYSHLSASEAWMAYALAITDRIHIGSGIINITPPVCHPARVAEKVAMLDQLAPGRFEFGTGRGSSSVEVFGFDIDSMDVTRDMYDEALPEIIKMMGPDDYGPYEGEFFSMPRRQQLLPKPVTQPHPPIWVAAGSPGTFEKAARLGIGVLCFSFAGAESLKPLIEIYKNTIDQAEPVGGYVNNNVMVTTAMMCMEDGDRARQVFQNAQADYHTSLVAKYLDSFPQTAGIDKVPTLKPPIPLEVVNRAIEARAVAVGTPDEAINTMRVYEEIGADQVTFGVLSDDTPFDAAVESVETFGKYVIPEFDKDPVCSTTRQREAQLGMGGG